MNLESRLPLQGVEQLTLSAWMKRGAQSAAVEIGKQANNGGDTIALEMWTDGSLYFGLSGSGSYAGGSTPLNDTAWHHVALVYDGTQTGNANRLKGYVDGNPVTLSFTGTIPAKTTTATNNFTLGYIAGYYSNGQIDDVRVYTRTLTQAEIQSDMNTALGGGTTTPPPTTPAPTVTLIANPTSITSGNSSTLSWTSTNATSCTASGGWTGTKATTGTQSVAPTTSTTYTLSCTGAGGTATQSVTVSVSTASGGGNTYYVATTGSDTSGNGSSGSPYRTIGKAISTMKGGDTVIVRNGTYSGRANFISAVPAGTSDQYSVVRAENPMEVRIKNISAESLGYYENMLLVDVNYVKVDGFIFDLADTVYPPYNAEINGDYNKVIRSIFKRSGALDDYGGMMQLSGSNNLIEDIAVVGVCRYCISQGGPTASTKNNVWRRVVGRFDYARSNQPKATFSTYGNDTGTGVSGNVYQNIIALDGQLPATSGEPKYAGIYTIKGAANQSVVGSIVLNEAVTYAGLHLGEYGQGNSTRDSVVWDLKGSASGAVGMRSNIGAGSVTATNVTIGGTLSGGFTYSGSGPSLVNALTVAAGTKPANLLQNSPGATIMNRIGVSGTLKGEIGWDTVTTESLWPWPYEDKIKAVFAETNTPPSGYSPATNNTKRGFAADGTGLYGGPITLTSYIWEYLGTPCPSTICSGGTTPTLSLTATPASVTTGGATTLSWSSANATACTASGGWTGTKTTSGTQSVAPTANTTYTLSCTGAGGTATQSVFITVSAPASTKFSLNDRVQVSSGPLNVRSTANTTGTLLGTQSTGVIGTIVGGPTAQGGFNWWQVNFDTGADGWAAEDFLVGYTAAVQTDIIATDRKTDWTLAGVSDTLMNRTTVCSQIPAGANASTIQSALNTCPAGQVVQLAAGTYNLSTGLTIPSNVTLRGAGPKSTILNAAGSGQGFIRFGSGSTPSINNSVAITAGGSAKSSVLTLASASGVTVGTHLMITELNDPSYVTITTTNGTCTWCDGGIGWNGTRVQGQMVEVVAVSGNSVTITPPLYIDYDRTPLATRFTMGAKNAGVEDLQVYMNNTGYTANFLMDGAAHSWIKNVESNYTDGDHVQVHWGYRNEIRDSYFHDGYTHSPGSTESSIFLANKTSGTLVENNTLRRLHASIVINWGASGNVISYNYMDNNFDSGGYNTLFPGIVTHGAHPMFNLFEGNVAPVLDQDYYWGSASHNTAFRNWFKGTTLIIPPLTGRAAENTAGAYWASQALRAVDLSQTNRYTNLLGNIIGSDRQKGMTWTSQVVAPQSRSFYSTNNHFGYTFGYANLSDSGSDAGNNSLPYTTANIHGDYDYVRGVFTWNPNIADKQLPSSLYLATKPSWFGTLAWPAHGPSLSNNSVALTGAIPAEHCFKQGLMPTCLSTTTPPPTTPAPVISLSASPTSITSGQSATLSWTTLNATSCTASGGWTGTKSTSGTQSVTPTASTTYTLSCTGAGGTTNQSVTVSVTSPASTKFSLSDRVQVSSGPLNVRSTANTTGTLLGTQNTAALGTIVGGPTAQGGYNWWNVNFDSGVDGWSVEDYLSDYVVPSPVTTMPAGVYTDLSSVPVGGYVTVYGIDSAVSSWPIVTRGNNRTVVQAPNATTALTVGGQSIPVAIHTGRVLTATPATMASIVAAIQPGDTIYLRGGTYSGKYDTAGWNESNFVLTVSGTAAQPIAFVAYPGEAVTIQNSYDRPYFNLGAATQIPNYITIAGFNLIAPQACVSGGGSTSDDTRPESGARYIRVVGNTCAITNTTQNTMTGMIALQGDGWKVLGNTFTNPANRVIINNNHAIYIQNGADDVEVAYNRLVGLRMGHVIQVHQDGNPMLYERISIHDNYLEGTASSDMRGVTSANVDSASTVTIANNTFRNLGQDFSAIAVYLGNVTITGNQFYDIGASAIIISNIPGSRQVTATGNRIGVKPGYAYYTLYDNAPQSSLILSGNSYCGGGALPSVDTTATTCGTTAPTPDTTAPSAPGTPSVTPLSASSLSLTWSASADTVGVTGYRLERCQGASCTTYTQIATPSGTTYTDTGLSSNTTYRYRVRATDAAGNLSSYSGAGSGTTNSVLDTTAPTVPGTPTITAPALGTLSLAWTQSTDAASGLQGYRVERCLGTSCTTFTQVGTPTTPAFTDTGLQNATTYRYRVRAVDQAQNLSAYTTTVSGTTLNAPVTDTTGPVLSNVTANGTAERTTITATTNEPARLRVDYGTSATTLTSTLATTTLTTAHALTLPSLTRRTTYFYRLTVTDQAGNSTVGTVQSFTTGKGKTAPIKNLNATYGSVLLSWGALEDPFATTIAIHRTTDGTFPAVTDTASRLVTLTDTNLRSYRDTTARDNTTYSYTLYVIDDEGTVSDPAMITFTPVPPRTSSGGGGGGGGGGKPKPKPTPTPTVPTNPTTPTVPSTPTTITTPAFTTPLFVGAQNAEVLRLQQFLIKQGFLAADSATGLYGPATEAAVKRYQCARNIVCGGTGATTGYGLVGNATRAKLNQEVAPITTTTTVPVTTTPTTLTPEARAALIQSLLMQVQVLMERLRVMRGY